MSRQILRLTGQDVTSFLQGLITNNMDKLADGPIYAALLTPQGKYIADFFVARHDDAVLIDVDADLGPALAQRLNMYKLRADVTIEPAQLYLHRGLGDAPADGYSDPRNAALGWRAYRDTPQIEDDVDWTALYVAHLVPQTAR